MTQDKPKVDLNLDHLERPASPEPFRVVIGAKPYQLRDIQDLDYRELLDAYREAQRGNPQVMVDLIVSVKDREAFFANKLPAWKLQQLFTAYNAHYGVTVGEVSGSPLS